jgi:hypothetical protein
MRLHKALPGMLLWMVMAASATPTVVRDWGLHRQWRMEIDPAHPERPARLVEIPWSAGKGPRASSLPQPDRGSRPKPAVRTGMRVTVVGRGARAQIRLLGTALGSGLPGETIAVRAGLGTSLVHGIVRGPGVVELIPEENR